MRFGGNCPQNWTVNERGPQKGSLAQLPQFILDGSNVSIVRWR